MINQNRNTFARSRQSDTIVVGAPKTMSSMDVLHRFMCEFRAAGRRALNTEIFETPAHAVMTGEAYCLKVWVAPKEEQQGVFKIKYEIDGRDDAASVRSGIFGKIFRA